jgi:hypothetical protein
MNPLDFLTTVHPVAPALLATLFTRGVTAVGALSFAAGIARAFHTRVPLLLVPLKE